MRIKDARSCVRTKVSILIGSEIQEKKSHESQNVKCVETANSLRVSDVK